MIERFQDLEVWQLAHQLALETYKITKTYPKEELFTLVSQMRRAAISVPANIAEGFKRRSPNEKVRFYNISESSLEELKYFFILSQDLGYCFDSQHLLAQADTISRKLYRLIQKVEGNM